MGVLTLQTIDLLTGSASVWASLPVSVAPGPSAIAWLTPNATLPNATTTLLLARLTADGQSTPFDEHLVHLTPPVKLLVKKASITLTLATQPNPDGSVDVTVATDAVALFVTLTTAAPGRFSDNAFLLLPSAPRVILWLPFNAGGDPAQNYDLLKGSLRAEDHSAYIA